MDKKPNTTTIDISERILASVKCDNYAGYDPFDSLNSEFIQKTRLIDNATFRLLFLQLGKRSPINLRPMLGIPKDRNPKGIALFILGMIQDYLRTRDYNYIVEATQLADWLLTQRCDPSVWRNSCWGYHFDWQARAFFVPRGKPNIITTVYVSRALYELGCLTRRDEYIHSALDSADFIASHLYTSINGETYYAYIPGEDAFVHNASLWGAAWCAFSAKKRGLSSLCSQALDVAANSASAQEANGAWRYGTLPHHSYIDGFHTGYNLEALKLLSNTCGTDAFERQISLGINYYLDTFILEDGTVKYYDNSTTPLDTHNFAQAILTILKVDPTTTSIQQCNRVVNSKIRLLYDVKLGRFIYQTSRWMRNSINYTRWTQAWAYYSLAYFNRFVAE